MKKKAGGGRWSRKSMKARGRSKEETPMINHQSKSARRELGDKKQRKRD